MKKYISEQKILYLMAISGAIIYISLIFNNNLWMDEAFSSVLVHTDFASMMERSANDTLPPLYNILNWIMTTLFGFYPAVLRLSSIIPVICVLFLSANKIYRRFNFFTCAIFMICITGMPSMLNYGTEIRMYALSLFFVTAAGIYAIECFYDSSVKNYIFLAGFTLGAAYTHHFAFVSCGGIYFFLLLALFFANKEKFKALKGWFISLIFIGILYLPNLFITLKQMSRVNGYFSMPDFSLSLIVSCIKTPFITTATIFSAILLLVYIILPVIVFYQKKRISALLPGLCCTMVFVFTMTFGLLVILILKSNIFTPRYLFPSYGMLWLGFAIFAGQIEYKKKLNILLSCFMIVICAITYHSQFCEEYRPGVDHMTQYFYENIDMQNDCYIIYEDNYQIEICFRYYFPEFKKTSVDNTDECNGNIWYLQVPGFEDKADTINNAGYQKEYVGDFNFDRYSFSLYKLSVHHEID